MNNNSVKGKKISNLEFEFEFQDVIHLIQQFCLENGLHSTFDSLSTESKITYSWISSERREQLQENILVGKWDLVIQTCEPLNLSVDLQIELYEQIVLELIEEREIGLARSILRASKAMNLLKQQDSERYLHLESLLSKPSLKEADLYNQATKQERRQLLAKNILASLPIIPESRLLHLLRIGATQEILQLNSSPSAYDLFRGTLRSISNKQDEITFRLSGEFLIPNGSSVEAMDFSRNGEYFAIGTAQGQIQLRNCITGAIERNFEYQQQKTGQFMSHSSAILCLAFCPDAASSTLLACGDQEGNCTIWNVESGKIYISFAECHKSGVTSVAWNVENPMQLLTAGYDGICKILSLRSSVCIREFRGHESWVNSAHFLHSSRHHQFISLSNDGTMRIWDANSGQCLSVFSKPSHSSASNVVTQLTFGCASGMLSNSLSKSECVVVGTNANFIYLVNLKGKVERVFEGEKQTQFINCCLSLRQELLYAISSECELVIFDVATGKRLAKDKISSTELICIKMHPFLNVLAISNVEGKVYLLQAANSN